MKFSFFSTNLETEKLSMTNFKTKADTLKCLEKVLKNGKVLPQFSLTTSQWNAAQKNINNIWFDRPDWSFEKLIIRSSSLNEDGNIDSKAGKYLSVKNVLGDRNINEAINQVIDSFELELDNDQVFIQPMLQGIKISGVSFTKDPNNGSFYYITNYDDHSGMSDTVTSGYGKNLKIFYHVKYSPDPVIKWKKKLIDLLRELEFFFKNENLDVEFAFDTNMNLYLFQVRPLVIKNNTIDRETHKKVLEGIFSRTSQLFKPYPYLFGKKAIFGIMPDWNPAEIIGIRPKPLALSLYKELITNGIWAYQRSNYGYRNLRSFPLLLSFSGLPYIDVRVSFNSFIPSDLSPGLADKLVNFYLETLQSNEKMHDKIEFDIVFSCYTFDLPKRIKSLGKDKFTLKEQNELIEKLRCLTNKIMNPKNGLWKKDIKKISELSIRQSKINNSDLSKLDKIYWLLEDCKRYGTLPFAGLARAGFIAVQFLQSMVNLGAISKEDQDKFMSSLTTISSSLKNDFYCNKDLFIKKYGHLRPGTYDITLPRYDENPDLYIKQIVDGKFEENINENSNFTLSLNQIKNIEELIKKHDLKHDVISIFDFIKGAIEGREYAKFVFTKSLSDILSLITELGEENNLDVNDLSFCNITCLKDAYSTTENINKILHSSVETGKKEYLNTCSITLPPLIKNTEDIYSFELTSSEPNFITQKIIQSDIIFEGTDTENLSGKILMIENADPGYDWIFLHKIKGFITKYGGLNSHMAIRAAELEVPAAIGSGEVLFKSWSKAKTINMDCANRQVRVVL